MEVGHCPDSGVVALQPAAPMNNPGVPAEVSLRLEVGSLSQLPVAWPVPDATFTPTAAGLHQGEGFQSNCLSMSNL